MYMQFKTVALFTLFVGAFSAPMLSASHESKDVWKNVKKNATSLNEIAKNILNKSMVHVERNVVSELALVDSKDHCDPESLISNSQPCIKKILTILKTYSDIFRRLCQCKDDDFSLAAKNVSSAVNDLIYQLEVPRSVNQQRQPCSSVPIGECSNNRWKRSELYEFSINRLYSFSIIVARVFSLGNPALHKGPGTERCTYA